MILDHSGPGPDAADRDRARYLLGNPLTVVTVRTQLLKRMIERSPGLSEQERATMLDQIAVVIANARDLQTQVDAALNTGLLTQDSQVESVMSVLRDVSSDKG